MNRRGVSIVETMLSLVLFGIVTGLLHGVLTSMSRLHQQQIQRASVNSTIRAAVSMLEPSMREVNAGDVMGSDITSLSSTAITIKTTRNLYFLCQDPDVAASVIRVGLDPSYGQVGLTGLDSVFVFLEGNSLTRTDDSWLHAGVASSVAGNECPGALPSIRITLSGVSSVRLDSVVAGAPVRGFDVTEYSLYDQDGAQWLGARRFTGGSWTPREILVGPMSTGGIAFEAFDADGKSTTKLDEVTRISLVVTGRTETPVSIASGFKEWQTAGLTTHVTLRNNPWF